MTVGDIAEQIEAMAPRQSSAEWDNVGLQVGSAGAHVRRVLVALDVTAEVVAEAEEAGAELIVSHHPLVFEPLRAVTTDEPVGALVARLLRGGVALYSAHTNLDAAPVIGTTMALSEILGLQAPRPLVTAENGGGFGAVGELREAARLDEFAEFVRERLEPSRLTVVGAGEAVVQRVALMPGSGGDAVKPAAAAGADALVCGDLKHHDALAARALGLAVVDAGHYATEHPVVARLAGYLRGRLGDIVEVMESQVCTDPFADETRDTGCGKRRTAEARDEKQRSAEAGDG